MDGSKGEAPWKETHLCIVERRACPRSALQQSAFFSLELGQHDGMADRSQGWEEKILKNKKKRKRRKNEEKGDNLFSSRFKSTMKSEPKNV